jgi:hypothetical protein
MNAWVAALNRKVVAKSTAPSSPTLGDTWVDTTSLIVKQYDGATWQEIGGASYSSVKTYAANDIVFSAGIVYRSLQAGNKNNTPASSPTYWLQIAPYIVPADIFAERLLHVRDEKAAGTNGGTFTSGAWRTRDLQTEKTNEISGASLASNQITLPIGTYYVEGYAISDGVMYNKARLYNTTASADLIIGSNSYNGRAGLDFEGQGETFISGRFTLAAISVLELQHWCYATNATYGFGIAQDLDSKVEVYSEVKIWKVA